MAQRTTVTIAFCDLVGSTALLNQIGEAANDELRRDVFSALRRPVELLGGTEVKTQGDGMMVAFSTRATDAIACSVAWQQAIDGLAHRDPSLHLALRVGISTGEVTAEEADYFGTPVVEAARLCAVAPTGGILASESVRLVAGDDAGIAFEPAGAFELKGFPTARAAYTVPWTPTAPAATVPKPPLVDVSGAMPFAGREPERQRIVAAVDAARAGARRTVLVAAPAGCGKTRLVGEALHGVDDVTVLAGQWTGDGRYGAAAAAVRWYAVGVPASTLRRVLGDDAGVMSDVVPAIRVRLPDLMESGGAEPADADAVIASFVDVFARIAGEGPLVVFFDDLHEASGPGLALFLELSMSPRVQHLALIGAFRTDDAGAVPPALAAVLDKLDRARDVERFDLGALTVDDVAAIAGPNVDGAAVFEATGGNAARVVDAVRLLVDARDPDRALSLALPFKGLLPFRPDDAPLFFGRDDEIGGLLGRLATDRFVAVVGTSGSGKSSLVFGGVLPALAAGRLAGEWSSVSITPGAHPEAALTAAVSESAPPRLVIVDQLEEVVTQCADPEERARFLDRLAGLAARRDAPVHVLVTLRADMFGAVATPSPAFAALLETGAFFLGPMSDDGLRAVIEGPASVAGLRLEPGLVDVVLGDVRGEPGALPLLSHALLETWKRRRGSMLAVANYRESGGANGAIARSADVVFESFDARGQALARELFLQLTELGEGTEDTRRRLTMDAAQRIGTGDGVARLIDALATARLVTVDEDHIEVAHEALIREWPRLREWLDESRDELRLQREVARRAEEWDRLGRPDAELLRGARLEQALDDVAPRTTSPTELAYLDAGRDLREREAAASTRQLRRLRALLAVALVLVLVAVAAGIVAIAQSRRANDRADEAREQSRLAEVQRISAESIANAGSNLRLALPLAVEGFRIENRYESRNALLSVLQTDPALLGYMVAPSGGYHTGAIDGRGTRAALAQPEAVDLVDLTTRTVVSQLPLRDVVDVAFLPDDRLVLATTDEVQVWNVAERRQVGTIDVVPSHIAVVDGNVLIGGRDGSVVLATPGGRVLARAQHGTTDVVVGVGNAGPVVTGGGDANAGTIETRDRRTLARVQEIGTTTGAVGAIAVSPDGQEVAYGPANSPIAITVKSNGTQSNLVSSASTEEQPVLGDAAQLAFASNDVLISAGVTGRTTTATTRSSGPPSHLTQFGRVQRLLATPDGSAIWAIGAGVVGWSLSGVDSLGGRPSNVFVDPAGLSPDGRYLLGTDTHQIESVAPPPGPDGTLVGPALAVNRAVVVLDARTLRAVLEPMNGSAIGFLSDNEHFVIADDFGNPRVVSRTDGTSRPLTTNAKGTPRVMSADGTRLALATAQGVVTVIDPETGQVLSEHTPPAGATDTRAIAFGPRDALAIAYGSGVQLADGRAVHVQSAAVTALAFSPDGQTLAAGNDDGTVRLFSVASGQVQGSWLIGHTGQVTSVQFSPNGQLVSSTATDETTRVFDVAARRPFGAPFPSTGAGVRPFSADGTHLLNATAAGVLAYDLDPATWVKRACDLAGENMTRQGWELYLPGRTPVATCPQYPPPR